MGNSQGNLFSPSSGTGSTESPDRNDNITKNRIEAEKTDVIKTDLNLNTILLDIDISDQVKILKYTDPYYRPWTFCMKYTRGFSIYTRPYHRLGIFDFIMRPVGNGEAVEAMFDHSKYDRGVLNAVVEPPGKVTFAATKAGRTETLEIVGPVVSIKETKGMTNVRIS